MYIYIYIFTYTYTGCPMLICKWKQLKNCLLHKRKEEANGVKKITI